MKWHDGRERMGLKWKFKCTMSPFGEWTNFMIHGQSSSEPMVSNVNTQNFFSEGLLVRAGIFGAKCEVKWFSDFLSWTEKKEHEPSEQILFLAAPLPASSQSLQSSRFDFLLSWMTASIFFYFWQLALSSDLGLSILPPVRGRVSWVNSSSKKIVSCRRCRKLFAMPDFTFLFRELIFRARVSLDSFFLLNVNQHQIESERSRTDIDFFFFSFVQAFSVAGKPCFEASQPSELLACMTYLYFPPG